MAAITSLIAAAGVATAVAGGAMAANAAKKAGKQQAAASEQALAAQRQAYANAFKVMEKYGVQGDWARNQMAAFMGGPQTGGGAPSRFADYVDDNADLGSALSGLNEADRAKILATNDANMDGILSKEEYGRYHYDTYGKGEGRALPGGDDALKTPDQLREEAYDNYKASPWAKTARTQADKASEDFTSMAGAQGSALSGRTTRGMAEVRNEMEQEGFGQYYSALSGMADTGFEADRSTVSNGQNFADAASGIYTRAGDNAARATTAEADAWSSALSDAAGWAGYGMGGMGGTTQKTLSRRTTGHSAAQPRGVTSMTRRAAIA